MTRTGWLVAAVLVLSGCATRAPRAVLPPVMGSPEEHQQQREAALGLQQGWSMQGRVALSNGRDGGSGRIEWEQDGTHYDVSLSAPVTRQSWRISGDPAQARLEGIDGGPLQGEDPNVLLRQATRWDIPVTALASWVRGLRADEARHGPARMAFGPDGRLATMEQDGWTVRYTAWQAMGGTEVPQKLEATQGAAKVRLIVDAWGRPAGD